MFLSNLIRTLFAQTNVRLAVWILTTAGFIWQVTLITIQFMAYTVTTRLDITDGKTTTPPTVAVCFGTRWTNFHQQPLQAMFDQVVEIDQTIESLRYWSEDLSRYETVTSPQEIYNRVTVIKFVKLQYICYSIESRMKDTIEYYDLTDNFERPKFYGIDFKPLLKPKANVSKDLRFFYTFTSRHMHGPSTTFAEAPFEYNFVTLGFKKYVESLLPPPYSTKCVDYTLEGVENRGECYEQCLLEKTEHRGIYPFDVIIDVEEQNLTWKRYAPMDYSKEPDFMRLIRKYRIECRRQCSRPDCRSNKFVPIIVSLRRSKSNFTLVLYTANEPDIRIHAISTLTLIDLVTYIFSCIGFWFGWSPVVLIPNQSIDEKKKAKNKKRKKEVFGMTRRPGNGSLGMEVVSRSIARQSDFEFSRQNTWRIPQTRGYDRDNYGLNSIS